MMFIIPVMKSKNLEVNLYHAIILMPVVLEANSLISMICSTCKIIKSYALRKLGFVIDLQMACLTLLINMKFLDEIGFRRIQVEESASLLINH